MYMAAISTTERENATADRRWHWLRADSIRNYWGGSASRCRAPRDGAGRIAEGSRSASIEMYLYVSDIHELTNDDRERDWLRPLIQIGLNDRTSDRWI